MPPTVQVTLVPTRLALRVFACILLLEIAFVLLDYHVNYGRLTEIGAIRRLTNIAREDGLASWFGTTQTLLVALTAWGIRIRPAQEMGLAGFQNKKSRISEIEFRGAKG